MTGALVLGAVLLLAGTVLDRARRRRVLRVARRPSWGRSGGALRLGRGLGSRMASPARAAEPTDSAGTSGLRRRLARLLRRHRNDPREELVPLLDELATALSAGLPAPRAVSLVLADLRAPWAADLLAAASDGRRMGPAWQRACLHAPLHPVARAWTLSEATGAPLADAIGRASAALRADLQMDRRRAATTAGARVTMNLLTGLPVLGILIVLAIGLDPVTVYANPVGGASAAVGVLLVVAGRGAVGRLVESATRGSPA